MLLEGRVAVISGIGPGLGRSIAVGLAKQGADLVISARSTGSMGVIAEEITALGRNVVCVQSDITRPDDCTALVAAARSAFPRIDVLVNNAYLWDEDPELWVAFDETDLDAWRPFMEVNFFGTLNVTRATVPLMKEQGGGSIVQISAMSTRNPVSPGLGAYASSKAALNMSVRTLAFELGQYGIRVNAVLPGWIDSGVVARLRETDEGRPLVEKAEGEIPIRHIPTPDEVAGGVVFLASDLAGAVTGQCLDVNGGHYFNP